MNTHYLEKLEFNKVLDILSGFCSTYIGRDLVLNLVPSTNYMEVQSLLSETEEAINLMYKNQAPSFISVADITLYLKTLEVSGILSIRALIDLANILKLSLDLKNYFNKDYIESSEYPILSNIFSNLYSNSDVIDKIFSSIIDKNTLDDKASKELQSIRKKKRNLEQDIRNKLNDFIHSSNYSKYIQENIITIRNDRFVIPVKEEYRSQIKGFVHDVSNAGSTVFIEPISIFDMNNELNQLKIEEEIEIEKILQELSSLFYPYILELNLDIEFIGKLDFIFAKAKYSKSIKGTTPLVNSDKYINLINARHPLLDNNIVVPISLNLGKSFSSLLITGPNTGGKTVTLKTVGILTLMACSGLNIPADENSSIYVFDNVFADIGDEQSIADSLSTFSSHMINISKILETATDNSLVLLDELGSGTDPLEGANLAISILEYLQNVGTLSVVTTHYPELKKYALVTTGFENASVEFDIETLSPTYKLLVGIPGKSNAFEISKKLGIKDEIIQKAKSLMSNEDINFEEVLKNIYDNKLKIEKEKEKIIKESEEISVLKSKLQNDSIAFKNKEDELINKAKSKARDILFDAKEEASDIIKQMNNISDSKTANNLRNSLNSKINNLNIVNGNFVDKELNCIDRAKIKPNTNVFISTLNQDGVVLSNISKSNEVQVQIGSLKMNINIKYLEEPKVLNKKNTKFESYNSFSKSKTVKTEVNVIGLNSEEAIFVVDKFLDDCYLAKLQNVRIVHGKGTGKLKTEIHKFLKTHSHIKSYRLGTYGEGEAGVTVVEFK